MCFFLIKKQSRSLKYSFWLYFYKIAQAAWPMVYTIAIVPSDENSTVMAYDFCGRTLTRSGQDLGQD